MVTMPEAGPAWQVPSSGWHTRIMVAATSTWSVEWRACSPLWGPLGRRRRNLRHRVGSHRMIEQKVREGRGQLWRPSRRPRNSGATGCPTRGRTRPCLFLQPGLLHARAADRRQVLSALSCSRSRQRLPGSDRESLDSPCCSVLLRLERRVVWYSGPPPAAPSTWQGDPRPRYDLEKRADRPALTSSYVCRCLPSSGTRFLALVYHVRVTVAPRLKNDPDARGLPAEGSLQAARPGLPVRALHEDTRPFSRRIEQIGPEGLSSLRSDSRLTAESGVNRWGMVASGNAELSFCSPVRQLLLGAGGTQMGRYGRANVPYERCRAFSLRSDRPSPYCLVSPSVLTEIVRNRAGEDGFASIPRAVDVLPSPRRGTTFRMFGWPMAASSRWSRPARRCGGGRREGRRVAVAGASVWSGRRSVSAACGPRAAQGVSRDRGGLRGSSRWKASWPAYAGSGPGGEHRRGGCAPVTSPAQASATRVMAGAFAGPADDRPVQCRSIRQP